MKRIFLIAILSLFMLALGATLAELRHRLRRIQPTQSQTLLSFEKQPSAWQTLLLFENQDLGNVKPDAAEMLQHAINTLTQPADSNALPYEPRLFRTMSNESGETRYVLVEERPLVTIPSESRLRVHIFDMSGQLRSRADFAAGWRTVLTAMNIRKNYFFKREALTVYGQYCFGGSSSTQHYVLLGDSITLAYLETNGKFERNDYTDTNSRIGPLVQRSADEWEAALNSSDTANVTSALIWLGGLHWNGQASPYDEDKLEAQKVSTLLARDSVKKRVNDLTKSDYSWVNIAARSVLDPNGT